MKSIFTTLVLFLFLTNILLSQTLENDRLALLDLYNNTNGGTWGNNTNWAVPGSPGDNPCGWNGITCENGRVTRIILVYNGLDGTLPSTIGNMDALVEITLSSNNFSGSIPSEWENLSNLRILNVAYSNLNIGAFPNFITNMTSLELLWMGSTGLTGTIPAALANLINLGHLDISNNELEGSIPSFIGNYPQLYTLYLNGNNLTGQLPASFSNLSNKIRLLDLSWNSLQLGDILPLLATFNLKRLLLARSGVTGSIPNALSNSTELENLYLYDNPLSAEPIPSFLYNMTSLQYFNLARTNRTGTIDNSISNLTNLRNLDLSQNELTGTIPDGIGSNTNLYYLYLGSNQFSGGIPSSFSNLTMLRHLSIGNNYMMTVGEIPAFIYNFVNLDYLELADCGISGGISESIGNLSNLTNFNISHNYQMSGPIPNALGTLSNLRYLYMSSCNLSGTIPSTFSGLSNLRNLDLANNQLDGSIPSFLKDLLNLNWLYLRNNQFDDVFPTFLGNMPQLRHLSIGGYQNQQGWPTFLASLPNLESLYIDNSNLESPIPAEIGNLTNLKNLGLHGNNISGTIPNFLGNMPNLRFLSLGYNNFSGQIPNELALSNSLGYLYVDGNQLIGPLPNFSNNLYSLAITQNHFTFDGIEANLPLNYFRYEPQQKIPISKVNNTLSVAAGGVLGDNTYKWYRKTLDAPHELIATMVGNNSYSPAGSGVFFVEVTNINIPDMTLVSEDSEGTQIPGDIVINDDEITDCVEAGSYNVDVTIDVTIIDDCAAGFSGTFSVVAYPGKTYESIAASGSFTNNNSSLDLGNLSVFPEYELLIEIRNECGESLMKSIMVNIESCSNGCPESWTIMDKFLHSGTYSAQYTISSSGIVESNSSVIIEAGTSVTLAEGFHAQANCNFTAKINGCTPSNNIIDNTNIDSVFKAEEPISVDLDSIARYFSNEYKQPEPIIGNEPIAYLYHSNQNTISLDGLKIKVYPNPFTSSAILEYTLLEPEDNVSISVLNSTGQIVKYITSKKVSSKGIYRREINGINWPSGIYFIRLQTNNYAHIERLIHLE